MRTFIIIVILICTYVNQAHASVINELAGVIDKLLSSHVYKYTSYGDDNNYNYNNDDDDNSNYNNDDDNYSNNDDDNYSSGDDDNYSNGDDDDDSSEIPLDGGLSFLAAAGAGLGIKKLRDNRAKKKAERTEK